ncbi:MAG: hypothetical protein ABI183_03480 [Polyangiaceae bacterium]
MPTRITMMTTTTMKSRRKKQRRDPGRLRVAASGRLRVARLGLVAAALTLCGALVSASAHASLTPSETNLVREFYVTAKPNDAAQVRALVARPDLSAEESASALSTAVGSVAFTPQRAAFLHAVVFASASLPSRSVLALATTHGVLARANDVIAKFEGDFDAHADAMSEVQRIFVFLEQDIASAAIRRGVGGPPESGISPATYDECTKAIADASALHPKWLKVDTKLSPAAEKVRAQEQLALFDMMNESPTFRVDAADKLGLIGARRNFFMDLGVLILDDGKASDARVDAARGLFLRLPAARAGVEAVYFGDAKPGLVGGGAKKKELIAVKSSLDSSPTATATNLFPDDLPQNSVHAGAGTIDPALADLAHDLSLITVRRALENRGDLALQTTRDARAAIDGKMLLGKALTPTPVSPASPSPSPSASSAPFDEIAALAQAVELVAVDARAAFDVARARHSTGHNEPAALFSDAVGILAVYAPPAQVGSGLSLAVGKSKGDGTTETVMANDVHLAPSGIATALMMGGETLVVAREANGDVTGIFVTGGKTSAVHRPNSK